MNQAQEPIKAPNAKKAGNKRLSDPNGSTGPQKGAAKQSGLASSKPLASSPAPEAGAEQNNQDFVTELWLRFGRYGWDVAGVGLIAFALMTLIGFIGLGIQQDWTKGYLISVWLSVVSKSFGWGWPLVVFAIGLMGLLFLRRRFSHWPKINLGRVLALECVAFSFLALMAIWNGWSLDRAEAGLDGGTIGWGLATMLDRIFPDPWGAVFVVALIILMTGYGSGVMSWSMRRLEAWLDGVNPGGASSEGGFASPDVRVLDTTRLDAKEEEEASESPSVVPGMPLVRDPNLPPLSLLLDEQNVRPDEDAIQETAQKIEHTLSEFGVPARVVGFRVGPTVTQYAVEPGFVEKPGPEGETLRQKVRVSQISALSRDLALSLSAERLRIEAPVPGRSYVGIEVPNPSSAIVRMRSVIECEAWSKLSSPLAVALGRDVSGQPLVADLARMPHLLIAGTTGSGKSVCISAIAACLVMNNQPSDLRMAMLDPKMVELVRFNGLPHLLGKVETELDRMLGVLRWALMEMDHRYKLLEDARTRDILVYNRKMEKRGQPTLPRIVLFIDELADLMMTAPDQTEHNLIRLAQMARATGIHLVVATQRPSTDVVTGLIKANFPARLAFTVASSIDSRVILDGSGAETLLGKGDMLFLNPEVGTPLRAQCVWVSDDELEAVTSYWKQKTVADPKASEAAPWEGLLEKDGEEDGDALVEQAIKIVRATQRASTSLLQRRLRVGYPRAARLMDELEELGVVGPGQGGGRERDVLLPPEEGDDDGINDPSESHRDWE